MDLRGCLIGSETDYNGEYLQMVSILTDYHDLYGEESFWENLGTLLQRQVNEVNFQTGVLVHVPQLTYIHEGDNEIEITNMVRNGSLSHDGPEWLVHT